MKNTIISNIKRVALTLFAALFVCNVWADVKKEFFFPDLEEIKLSSSGEVYLQAGAVATYAGFDFTGLECTVSLIYTVEREGMETVCVTNELTTFDCSDKKYSDTPSNTAYWYFYTFKDKETNEDRSLIKYYYQIPNFDEYLGSKITIGVNYKLNQERGSVIGGKDLALRSEYTDSATFVIAGITDTKAEWVNNPKKFVISGGAVDVSKVLIKYKVIGVSDATPSDDTEFTAKEVNVVGNAYSLDVEYSDFASAIVWSITADGEEKPYQEKIFRQDHYDLERVVYTWSGLGETKNWADTENWTPSIQMCYGYPGIKGKNYYYSSVRFEDDAEVDLNQGSYTLRDGGDSLYFEPGVNVVLKNGELGLLPQELPGDGNYVIGASGATVEYQNVKLVYATSDNRGFNLAFAAGSTNIFVGTMTYKWNYLPLKGNTKVVFKDGEITTESSSTAFTNLDTHELEVNNATWKIAANNNTLGATHGIAGVVKFRDGNDRQARIVVNKALKLQGTYDFILPEASYSTSYVEAEKVSGAGSYCNIRIDASKVSGDCKVPIMCFSKADENTEASMAIMTNSENTKLQVLVDGVQIDNATLNAKLVWDEAKKTLYYKQGANEVVPGGDAITVTAADKASALEMVDLKVTPPEGLTADEAEAYEAAFTKDAKDNGDGSWTITAILAETAKPLIGESAADAGDAFTVDAENVVITIQNYVKGLNYGVISADEVTKLKTSEAVVKKATVTDGKITLEKSGDTMFYKVIVDFNEIKESLKAE